MPRRVKGPDGVVHSFPDDATDQEISGVLEAVPNANRAHVPNARTWVDTAVDWLPTAGGAVGALVSSPGVVTSVGGAALGAGAGEAAKQLINTARGKAKPSSMAAARDIANESVLSGAFQAAGAGVGKVATAVAPRLVQSALKPAQSLLDEYRTTAPEMAKFLLNEGVSVTSGGLRKLDRLLKSTNDEIRTLVANASGTIPKKRVAAEALNVAQKVSKQTNPTSDLKKVGDTVQEFLDHPVYKGDLTIPEAQAMKQGTYQQVGKKYGEIGAAEVETQKALARGLKNEIADAVPEIVPLNARDSQLMGAGEAVGRRVAQAGNRDPVGFAWAATENPKAFLAALIDRSPAVKSMLARGLWTSAARATGVEPQLIAGAVRSLVSSEDEK